MEGDFPAGTGSDPRVPGIPFFFFFFPFSSFLFFSLFTELLRHLHLVSWNAKRCVSHLLQELARFRLWWISGKSQFRSWGPTTENIYLFKLFIAFLKNSSLYYLSMSQKLKVHHELKVYQQHPAEGPAGLQGDLSQGWTWWSWLGTGKGVWSHCAGCPVGLQQEQAQKADGSVLHQPELLQGSTVCSKWSLLS